MVGEQNDRSGKRPLEIAFLLSSTNVVTFQDLPLKTFVMVFVAKYFLMIQSSLTLDTLVERITKLQCKKEIDFLASSKFSIFHFPSFWSCPLSYSKLKVVVRKCSALLVF